jgi:hypothetical protein
MTAHHGNSGARWMMALAAGLLVLTVAAAL